MAQTHFEDLHAEFSQTKTVWNLCRGLGGFAYTLSALQMVWQHQELTALSFAALSLMFPYFKELDLAELVPEAYKYKLYDNNTPESTNWAPTGIEAVFINGKQVLNKGRVDRAALPGKVL